MEQKETKLGFFSRLKKAIFELEDYGFFLGEKLTVAFKYFFILIFIISVIFSLSVTYKSFEIVKTAHNYINNELPDFEYKDGSLHFDNVVDAYDHNYKFTLLADTTDKLSEEKIKEYKNKVYKQGNYGAILLKTKVILITTDFEDSIHYVEYFKNINKNDVEDFKLENKQDLINLTDKIGISDILIVLFIGLTLGVYVTNIFMILSDVCLVAIFGWFAARICGVKFKMNPMIAMSIYALTLSIVLDLILDVVYIMTGFVVPYFNIIYLLIAYVYIIAAIFMIKYDLIKHTEELKKIIEVQGQVQKDLAEEKNETEEKDNSEPKEKNDEKKEEERPEENKDPDGSEI